MNATATNDAEELARVRRFHAEDVCFPSDNRRLIDAFATVPREAFVGPGPWLIQNRHTAPHYVPTKDADPRHLYHDVHIALDASGFVNSGGPGFNAFLLNLLEVQPGETVVYLGMGCGYYAAVLAELVGPRGNVVAIEVHPERAAQAGKALAPWPQVTVKCANGATEPLEPCDVLIAGAGVTHPPDVWLEALKVGGRMIFPLMGSLADEHWGVAAVLYARRESETSFEARRLCDASYLEFIGARNAHLAERIDEALAQDGGATIASLQLDSHPHDPSCCWLHSEDPAHPVCLSRLPPGHHHQTDPAELPGVGLKLTPLNQLNILPYGCAR